MTFWILGVLAGYLTLLAIRRNTFVYYVCASLAWWALWGYNINNPPSNITAGTFVYDLVYYTLFMMALGTFLLYFATRGRVPAGYNRTAKEQAEYDREYKENSNPQLDGVEEYRREIRRRMALGRARRRRR